MSMKFSLLNISFLYDSNFMKFAKRNSWKKYMKFSANFLPMLSEFSVLSNESCTAENLSQNVEHLEKRSTPLQVGIVLAV